MNRPSATPKAQSPSSNKVNTKKPNIGFGKMGIALSLAAFLLLSISATAQITEVPQTGFNTVSCGSADFQLQDNNDGAVAGYYANDSDGYTVLEAGDAKVISIVAVGFTRLADGDFLYIREGAGNDGRIIQQFGVGLNSGVTFTSEFPGQTISVHLVSDFNAIQSGFDWTVSYTQGDCVGAACSTPNPGGTIGPATSPFGAMANLGLSAPPTTSGMSYQWQESATSGGPWANVGTDSKYYNTVLFDPTYFQCIVTCTNGPASTTSAEHLVDVPQALNIPTTGNNIVPCGHNVTLFDSGGPANNYVNGSSGYTVLEAGDAQITISGTVELVPGDVFYVFDGIGTGGTELTSTGTGTFNFDGAIGQTLTVQLLTDGIQNNGFGLDLAVTYSGACSTVGIGEQTNAMNGLTWLGQEGTLHRIDLGDNQVDQVSVYDISGRVVNTSTPQLSGEQLLVDLSGQAPGIYMVHLEKDGLQGVLRLVHQ